MLEHFEKEMILDPGYLKTVYAVGNMTFCAHISFVGFEASRNGEIFCWIALLDTKLLSRHVTLISTTSHPMKE